MHVVFLLLIVTLLLYAGYVVVHLHDCALLFLNLYIVQIIHEVVVGFHVVQFASQARRPLLLVIILVFFDLRCVLVHQLCSVFTSRFVDEIHALAAFLPPDELLKRLRRNELVIFQPVDRRLDIFGSFVTTLVDR